MKNHLTRTSEINCLIDPCHPQMKVNLPQPTCSSCLVKLSCSHSAYKYIILYCSCERLLLARLDIAQFMIHWGKPIRCLKFTRSSFVFLTYYTYLFLFIGSSATFPKIILQCSLYISWISFLIFLQKLFHTSISDVNNNFYFYFWMFVPII